MEQSGKTRRLGRMAAGIAVLNFGPALLSASAKELTVTHYGTSMYGVPYTVAKEKNVFKEVGLDVTGFITSAGGGTTVRNALASEIPYGEVATSAAIAAIKQGLPITIVNSGVNTVGDILWVITQACGSGLSGIEGGEDGAEDGRTGCQRAACPAWPSAG